jgi:predicted nucleic acid-binding protein
LDPSTTSQSRDYDAAYLELALRTGLPLATLDADLAKAATTAGVPLFSTH